jgi:ABC-2 type transport system permease protein
MTNLLQAELFKLRRNKAFRSSFWTIMLIGLGFTLLFFLDALDILTISVDQGFLVTRDKIEPIIPLSGLEIFKQLIGWNLYFVLFFSVLGGFFVSNDYHIGVMKTLLISGYSRSKIFFAKLIVLSIGSILLALLFFLIPIIAASIIFGLGSIPEGTTLAYMARVFALSILHWLAFVSVVMVFAILLKESGKTITVFFGFFLIALILSLVVAESIPIIDVLFANSIFRQLLESTNQNMTNVQIVQSIAIAIGTFILFSLLGNYAFQKKDVK